jgi:DNA topoisomerase-1
MGHITYMRTESRKYSPVFTEIAAKYIAETWSKEHVNVELQTVEEKGTEEIKGTTTDSEPSSVRPLSQMGAHESDPEGPSRLCPKGTTESGSSEPLAHEAIRVTNIHMRDFTVIGSNMASLERMYKMIWQNTVQSCMSNATFNCLPLSVSSADLKGNYKHTIETVKFAGFLDAKDAKHPTVGTTSKEKEKVKGKAPDMSKVSASIVLQHNSTKGAPIPYNYIETIIGFTAHHSRFTEASLIDKLDELGIGRPSTFSMLTDVIQTRKYVEKTDVAGVKFECREYKLVAGSEITHKSVEKMMGAEHKKLVIDPIGITVVEFLLQHFAEFFSYNYTNMMEKRLDAVAAGAESWHQVCADCDKEIGKLIKALDSVGKRTYKVGDDYILFFHKNGMLLRSIALVDGKCTFKSIKRGVKVDMAKLERGEYTVADLAEIDEIVLGLHSTNDSSNVHSSNVPVTLKPGKYGYYLEVDSKKISVDKELKALKDRKSVE